MLMPHLLALFALPVHVHLHVHVPHVNPVSLVIHFFYQHEYAAIFFLLLLEEAGLPLPVPGDTLIALAGARRFQTPGYVVLVLFLTTAAVFFGSSILYYLMRRGGRPLLEKYGKYLHLNEKRLHQMENWFEKRGPAAIIVGRLIPGLRIPTTVIAGLSGVSYRVFGPTAAFAGLLWASIYFVAGALLDRNARLFSTLYTSLLDVLSDWAIVIALIVLVSVGTWFVRRHAHRRTASVPEDEDTPVTTP